MSQPTRVGVCVVRAEREEGTLLITVATTLDVETDETMRVATRDPNIARRAVEEFLDDFSPPSPSPEQG